MDEYNFNAFLERMSKDEYVDILKKAEYECNNIEKSSFGTKGCVNRRKKGSVEYLRSIEHFLFYMRHGIKPSGIDDKVFLKYRIVVKALVDATPISGPA